MPILVVGIVGLAVTAWTLKEADQALESGAEFTKWATIAGGTYLAYRGLKSAKVI